MKYRSFFGEATCPHCGKVVDGHMATTDDARPEPGDISLCISCGGISEYGRDFELIVPADTRMAELLKCPTVIRAQHAIRQMAEGAARRRAARCGRRSMTSSADIDVLLHDRTVAHPRECRCLDCLIRRASGPRDEEILTAIGSSHLPTYAIKNTLNMAFDYGLKTPAVLRRLKRLERHGRVVRVPTSYAVMIDWRVADDGEAPCT